MQLLTPDQRNGLYLQAAERTGIHKPILAALYAAHHSPKLSDREVGLGISPENQVSLEQVSTFLGQVHYAASSLRSFTNRLTAEGWKGEQMWNGKAGCYSDRFLAAVANGFAPAASDPGAARLERCSFDALMAAYQEDIAADWQAVGQAKIANVDTHLLNFVQQVPNHYYRLPSQRAALQELVRLWSKQDTIEQTLKALELPENLPEFQQEAALLQRLLQTAQTFAGYPHQREALLQLVRVWRQLDSRERAIASLVESDSPALDPAVVDTALVTLVQQIPQQYRSLGDQRDTLLEWFCLWQGIRARSDALVALGVSPEVLSRETLSAQDAAATAAQIDRGLITVLQQVPHSYEQTPGDREILLRLAQLWRKVDSPDQTLQSLCQDLSQMQHARPGSVDAPPVPLPLELPKRPASWTPETIQLFAPIMPNGSLTWADATRGGINLPMNQAAVDAIVRVAELAEHACNRLGRPLHILNWYSPIDSPTRTNTLPGDRYSLGDAIVGYCEGLSGDQLFWFLDPWWSGGLGRFTQYPYLCHLDAQPNRVRWQQ